MQDGLDFIKIKRYAVINLNNMFPAPAGQYSYVDISKQRDPKYKALLLAEKLKKSSNINGLQAIMATDSKRPGPSPKR